jgi:hypothetical protein
MMTLSCKKCQNRFEVPDDHVRGTVQRFECQSCGDIIVVGGESARGSGKVIRPDLSPDRHGAIHVDDRDGRMVRVPAPEVFVAVAARGGHRLRVAPAPVASVLFDDASRARLAQIRPLYLEYVNGAFVLALRRKDRDRNRILARILLEDLASRVEAAAETSSAGPAESVYRDPDFIVLQDVARRRAAEIATVKRV